MMIVFYDSIQKEVVSPEAVREYLEQFPKTDRIFNGSSGMYELIFYNNSTYNSINRSQYSELLKMTDVHRKSNSSLKPTGQRMRKIEASDNRCMEATYTMQGYLKTT